MSEDELELYLWRRVMGHRVKQEIDSLRDLQKQLVNPRGPYASMNRRQLDLALRLQAIIQRKERAA